ncbi:hypothetical protein IFT69_15545 [Pseudomonas putida]|nr:hypothetical protein [Pseudomonas putida]
MTTPYRFELNSFDITVQDPASSQSWVEGLMPLIEDLAEDNGVTQFERWDNISTDAHRKVGVAIHDAMKNYRIKAEGDKPFKTYLSWALNDAWGDESMDWFIDNISRRPVDDLYSDLDDIMAEYDGPVASIDEVIDDMAQAMEDKIRENDDSSCLDLFSGHSIQLTFNPFYDPFKSGVDDLMVYHSALKDDLESHAAKSLIEFLRLDKKQVLSMLSFDYKDTDGIRSVLDSLRAIDHSLPAVVNTSDLVTMFDNAGNSCVYPHWHGEIDFDELLNCDPDKPLRLKGGVIALVDVINGSGDYVSLPEDSVLVMNPTQYPSPKYWSYGCEEVFGGCRSYEATIKPFNIEVYQAMEVEKKRQRKLGYSDVSLGE